MSRKQSGKPVRGTKKCSVERKRDERAARRANAKDRKNRPQEEEAEEFISFSNQLQALGLKLREVPGDGNCLFRALGDQLEGHSRGHLRLRQETVQYMMSHRQDFEPFVEDDVPFTQHLANLAQPGTFAGNDAIVAFARSQQLKVVIHQLNTPLWEINGSEKLLCRELHIAYRYGDHYDSLRLIGDNSESPAQLRIENLHKSRRSREIGDGQRVRRKASSSSSVEDDLILNSFASSGLNSQEEHLRESKAAGLHPPTERPGPEFLTQTCTCQTSSGSCSLCHSNTIECSESRLPPDGSMAQKNKLSNKQRKEQQRLEKKKHQEEKHRHKFLQGKTTFNQNQNLPEPVTLVPAFNTLSI